MSEARVWVKHEPHLKEEGGYDHFAAHLRIDLFVSGMNKGSSSIIFFQLHSAKTDIYHFRAWSPSQVSWEKFLFSQVKTGCACRVGVADYEYHDKRSQNFFIVLTTLLAPFSLVGPLTKLILVNISEKIPCLTQNLELSTNLDFLRQKNLISEKKGRFRGPNWLLWLYRYFSLRYFSWS